MNCSILPPIHLLFLIVFLIFAINQSVKVSSSEVLTTNTSSLTLSPLTFTLAPEKSMGSVGYDDCGDGNIINITTDLCNKSFCKNVIIKKRNYFNIQVDFISSKFN